MANLSTSRLAKPINGISFDYKRPTVSEFTVISVKDHYANLKINKDSWYSTKDSLLTWEGEGWRYTPGWYWQSLNPATGILSRINFSLNKVRFAKNMDTVRAYFKDNPGFNPGLIFQTRDVVRDCAGIFMQRSKNIMLNNMRIYYMHGMGVVSQFCENITLNSIVVRPDENSGRTCSAWADILHFSGCRGKIEIKNSYLSSSNDDAINIHGTHLRIVGKSTENQIRVRFMHAQTYGFTAFSPGDSINFIHARTLLNYGANIILKAEMTGDKEFLLTLAKNVPQDMIPDDVIENVTWTPEVWIHHNTITLIPTRGILITTRRKAVIEDNVFRKTNSSAILVADDAESWFESGMVRNLAIISNSFIGCGDPVINIHPENLDYMGAVHQNISVTDNLFDLSSATAFEARSSAGLRFSGNTIESFSPVNINDVLHFDRCNGLKIDRNKIVLKK